MIELIKRYEADSEEFPSNIKTFISTHDAVRYLQSVRSKQLQENGDHEYVTDDSEHEVEDSLSSLSKPSLENYTPQVGPVNLKDRSSDNHSDGICSPRKRNSSEFTRELSDLDIAHERARKNTFSFRGTPRTQNHSHSTHTHLESDTEEDNITATDPEYKSDVTSPNVARMKIRNSSGSDTGIPMAMMGGIPRMRWGDINKSSDHKSINTSDESDGDSYKPIEMRIVDSLTQQNITKIDEMNENEQEESDKSKGKNDKKEEKGKGKRIGRGDDEEQDQSDNESKQPKESYGK